MKILHTADWHLGKKLDQTERTLEHQAFLNWLVGIIQEQGIELLIVAGDIFDTGTPSNIAMELYYRFLSKINTTCCRQVIIIGGNHDSISTLNAPRELLRFYQIHILGGVPENFNEQIIEVKNKDGELELVVCAVPFLRDRDIRLSLAGETDLERQGRVRQGIADHYHQFLGPIQVYKDANIPVLATGHLFAAGSSQSDSEKEIHVGNLGQVHGDQFPTAFDYIALGHIHRPQIVNQLEHIRYAGSPIPLSFSETEDKKQVVVLEFLQGRLTGIVPHLVPTCRRLVRVKGNLNDVFNRIAAIVDLQHPLPCWVEVQLETDALVPDLNERLQKLGEGLPFIEQFFVKQIPTHTDQGLDLLAQDVISLNDLSPKAVFLQKCGSSLSEEELSGILSTFDQALEDMAEEDRS